MVPREAQPSGLKTRPTTMMCTQSVLVDVPTDDVNFNDVVDDFNNLEDVESETMKVSTTQK